MLKHTPGPWRLDSGFNVIGRQVDEERKGGGPRVIGTFVAAVEPTRADARNAYYAPGPEAPANAVLIATAPELLAALKLAVSSLEAVGVVNATLRMAQNVIAKAEGRGENGK